MPSQGQMWSRRNSKGWDDLLQRMVDAKLYHQERPYVGIVTEDEADRVRRAMATAGKRRTDASVKAYWKECGGCGCTADDGSAGRYHVMITLYYPDEALRYKQQQRPR